MNTKDAYAFLPSTVVYAVVDRPTQGIDFLLWGFSEEEQATSMRENAHLDVEAIQFRWIDAPETFLAAIGQPNEALARINRIPFRDLCEAAAKDDIDAAALHLQTLAGITDGGCASMCLDEETWPRLNRNARIRMLASWLDTERALVV